MEYPYTQTYKGITFYKTAKNIWLFADLIPSRPLDSWSRYSTDEESEIRNSDASDEDKAKTMMKAVDRMLARTLVYTGDLRYR